MRIKLSTRLILNSLLLSVVPLLIISLYALHIAENEITRGEYAKLALAREARLDALNYYLDQVHKQSVTLAEDTMMVGAMKDFAAAFDSLESELGKRYDADLAANENKLKAVYAEHESKTPGAPKDAVNKWWPKDRVARILQHYYLATNPYPAEDRTKFDFSTDGSHYSQIHKIIHPLVRNYLEKFEYKGLRLVDTEGRIVYTSGKRIDTGTNLITGPYKDTNMAQAFKLANAAQTKDDAEKINFVDIAPFAPFFNAHVSFIATPIFDGETKIGVLIFQLARTHLDAVMTNNRAWKKSGLGDTGEGTLVGSDHLLRSESRNMIENPTELLNRLKEIGVAEDVIKTIEDKKTVINYLEYQLPYVDDALNGKSGMILANDYLNNHSFIAYDPVKFGGVNWALIISMEESESFAGLNAMRSTILTVSLLLIALAAFIGWLSARTISKPIVATINTLSTSATQMAATTIEHERIANQQSASVNETNTTMEELGISSKQSAQQAQAASEVVQSVFTLANHGGEQVQEMLQGMEELHNRVSSIAQQILRLSEQTNQIGSITSLMTDFANETKMLAMNAAVEAVRAGEQGKGFSVLSVEIRKLAEESRHSAGRINALVEDVQKATNATVMATDEGTKTVEKTIALAHTTASSFNEVAESMHNVSTNAQQISLNIKQQAEAVQQVVLAMNELKTGAKEGAAGISQTKDGIKTLNEAAQNLKAMT